MYIILATKSSVFLTLILFKAFISPRHCSQPHEYTRKFMTFFQIRFNIITTLSPRSYNGLFPTDFGNNILY
jgi:hypothetical protein